METTTTRDRNSVLALIAVLAIVFCAYFAARVAVPDLPLYAYSIR